ncbi:MAG TPA: serine/threonine-protein kinase [Candidatus Hydrogenedentes bacterium]|nr:serine/threonine-protein kinase [Candidatus Hydrogenedentota bacterium]HOL77719.1 serine/threonine-protein kinase [Candidatus Hydrogenedentota bacterium]HPO86842.1 serine/threonine-protein kinase [Candidatus Hydrogenedentota bacterium]
MSEIRQTEPMDNSQKEQKNAAPEPKANRIGDYEILEEIGHGGMGVIYRALDLSLNRIVALKVLREDLRSQPQLVTRFRREAQAAALLNHPNIVHIYSVGEADGIPYIAMEYINGVPLSVIMQEEGPVHWEYALDIAEQIARALACAHAAQVIHRDIKPPNILIDSEGKAYVTDFGIAKILTAEEQLTVDGSRLGTPQYMSPERCRSGEVTAASDIYSLGVLLFQMITGRLPFEASSSVELVRKILSEQPPRVRQYNPNVPENVERLVAYLIEKKPSDRPESAEKVCIAIALVRAGRPLEEAQLSLRSALDEFRRTDTPKPSMARADATTKLLPENRLARFTLHWFGTPQPWKVGLAAVLVILAGSGMGILFSRATREDPRVTAMKILNADIGRWNPSAEVARFSDIGSGTLSAKVSLKDFTITHLIASREKVFAQLEGVAGSPREGQTMVCSFHPLTKTATISLEPFSANSKSKNASALEVLTTTHGVLQNIEECVLVKLASAKEASAWLYALPSVAQVYNSPRQILLQTSADSNASAIDPQSVTELDIGPDNETLAIAFEGSASNSSYLAELSPTDTASKGFFTLTGQGPPISLVKYSQTGENIAYVRNLNDRISQLWVVRSAVFRNATNSGASSRDGLKVAEGKLELSRKPFDPAGGSIAFALQNNLGRMEMYFCPLENNMERIELGLGFAPCWHPQGTFVLAVSLDRSQEMQLFAIETKTPYRRRQLTYISGGVQPSCDVTGNGQWAAIMPREGEGTVLCFVDLSKIYF